MDSNWKYGDIVKNNRRNYWDKDINYGNRIYNCPNYLDSRVLSSRVWTCTGRVFLFFYLLVENQFNFYIMETHSQCQFLERRNSMSGLVENNSPNSLFQPRLFELAAMWGTEGAQPPLSDQLAANPSYSSRYILN